MLDASDENFVEICNYMFEIMKVKYNYIRSVLHIMNIDIYLVLSLWDVLNYRRETSRFFANDWKNLK